MAMMTKNNLKTEENKTMTDKNRINDEALDQVDGGIGIFSLTIFNPDTEPDGDDEE